MGLKSEPVILGVEPDFSGWNAQHGWSNGAREKCVYPRLFTMTSISQEGARNWVCMRNFLHRASNNEVLAVKLTRSFRQLLTSGHDNLHLGGIYFADAMTRLTAMGNGAFEKCV